MRALQDLLGPMMKYMRMSLEGTMWESVGLQELELSINEL